MKTGTTAQDPKYAKTIRLACVISDTPANQMLMARVIEQTEHVLSKAEGFTVLKCCTDEMQFLGNPNGGAGPAGTVNPT